MWILSTPPRIAAASLDLKGFHDLYSTFWIGLADPSGAGTSTWRLFLVTGRKFKLLPQFSFRRKRCFREPSSWWQGRLPCPWRWRLRRVCVARQWPWLRHLGRLDRLVLRDHVRRLGLRIHLELDLFSVHKTLVNTSASASASAAESATTASAATASESSASAATSTASTSTSASITEWCWGWEGSWCHWSHISKMEKNYSSWNS